jgi:hypothetical protein
MRISADRCDITRRALGLPRRESWHGAKTGTRRAYIPSEEEIKARCEEFQRGWSEEERARRRVGWTPNPAPVEAKVLPDSVFECREQGPSGFLEGLIDTSG